MSELTDLQAKLKAKEETLAAVGEVVEAHRVTIVHHIGRSHHLILNEIACILKGGK